MRVARIYPAGRDSSHRERDRALVRAGADVLLVVPDRWPGPDDVGSEPFHVLETPVVRPGSVNAHALRSARTVVRRIADFKPDVVDLHEEPFSVVTRQLLPLLPSDQVVVGYTAQNLDKRFPPPFAQWEKRALSRLDGLYPCSRQAASVAVGKGFTGALDVLPLGLDRAMTPGDQALDGRPINLLLVGRLVPEKGVLDAVRVLASASARHDVRLALVGSGPEQARAVDLARDLGVGDRLALHPWLTPDSLAEHYRRAHVVMVPSTATTTWVEQFGRVVVEAQACGACVVAYASGSLPEVVGNAGVLVEEGDVGELTGAVLDLLGDPPVWRNLRERGLHASAQCTWDRIATSQVALYRDAQRAAVDRDARPHIDRARARARWGEPAAGSGVTRPFALPFLRRDSAASRALARLIDAGH